MPVHHIAHWVRHGDLTDAATDYRALQVAPTLVTDGIAISPDDHEYLAKIATIFTAAAGLSFTIIIWGYRPDTKIWDGSAWITLAGSGGWDNLGEIDVVAAASGRESHQTQGTTGYNRLAVQTTDLVGAPDIWVDLGFSPHPTKED